MNNQKKREELSNEFKWDLTKIYETDELWQKDYLLAKEEIKKVSNFKTDLLSNSKRLLEFLEYEVKTDRLLLKLYYFANLSHDSDTTNVNYQKIYKLITDLYNEYDELSSFLNPLFMKTDYKIIEEYYKEEPKIKEYKFNIDEMYRFQKHTLSEDTEKLLSTIGKILNNPSETYKALTDSDIKYGNIKDESGNEVELTDSNYKNFLTSENRDVRKNAFEIIHQRYEELKNTIASTFNGDIDGCITVAKLRNYDSAFEASLFADNIDKKVYDNLVNTVSNNLDILYKYYNLKKDLLNLDELHLYDIYVDLIPEQTNIYSFGEAKKLVVDSLEILGEDYISKIKKAFDEKWIDVYNNVGKRTGAYSSGFYDINPYILLNYEGKLDDVSTLAHELGHSIHTYYSCKNNPYQYSQYKIFVAEVASTVNELLLCKFLLNKSKDKLEKLSILNRLMELFKGTIFRQTMFAEFEELIYRKREDEEVLTHEVISDYYYDLNKKYFGENVVIDDCIRYEWERVPHFYYNFYVYKYATGLSAACYIVESILNNKENAISNYLDFLKSGGSDHPLNELKIAGVDMNDPAVVESAIKMFDETIKEFKNIYLG